MLSRSLLRRALLALAIAVALAAGSFAVQRRGPEMGEFGDFCGPQGGQPCYEPLLNAGWPLGYVVDTPGVSVQDKLGFEDDIRPELFAADVVFYFGLLTLAWRYGQMRRRLRAESRRRTESEPS